MIRPTRFSPVRMMSSSPFLVGLLHLFEPERAHRLALGALRMGLVPAAGGAEDPVLATRVWDRGFPNPVGLAAGFDKDGVALAPLLRLGFGFVEVGSVTPLPQAGNPKPRLFRLAEDRAVINRMGFNSAGLAAVAARLARFRRDPAAGIVGVNLGRNKDSADAVGDYAAGASSLAGFADYLVINVSSPNTPGLRALQRGEALAEVIAAVRKAVAERGISCPPLVVKLAPDLDRAREEEMAALVLEQGVSGLILCNTTLSRPGRLRSPHRDEAGGLSGDPLFAPSTEALRRFYRLTAGRLPLVGTGGIASGAQAYAKIRAGASLVQLYTGLVYGGPGLVARIKADLAALLRRDGFASVAEAVGSESGRPR